MRIPQNMFIALIAFLVVGKIYVTSYIDVGLEL
jgi:hypothetical protein